ncbi:flagellar basal body rod protein FlgB [Ferviditalea candida]|uniref:Flagellar basal body rod protein FlgB n=1 Tax=Ferviditalea candida TaxID=3108399 RepID=A0ABU5ZFA0_9BACL|nr:flagellar basal body rod protein FlgB [Paenibacillaceae bacterium T2]
MSLFENLTFNVLERSLDAAALRQKVISNNIANVDTPQFKRSDVQFEDLLKKELQQSSMTFSGYRTDPRHIQIGSSAPSEIVQPAVVTDEHSAMNNNNNNVDIDAEMASMAKNQLSYNVLIQQTNHELKQLRIAISQGR